MKTVCIEIAGAEPHLAKHGMSLEDFLAYTVQSFAETFQSTPDVTMNCYIRDSAAQSQQPAPEGRVG